MSRLDVLTLGRVLATRCSDDMPTADEVEMLLCAA